MLSHISFQLFSRAKQCDVYVETHSPSLVNHPISAQGSSIYLYSWLLTTGLTNTWYQLVINMSISTTSYHHPALQVTLLSDAQESFSTSIIFWYGWHGANNYLTGWLADISTMHESDGHWTNGDHSDFEGIDSAAGCCYVVSAPSKKETSCSCSSISCCTNRGWAHPSSCAYDRASLPAFSC